MVHRTTNKVIIVPPYADEWKGELPFFSLDGVLPADQVLSVNTDCLVISLVSTKPVHGNPILSQRLLTEQQLRVLLPLLESPHYCSHQLLLTSLFAPRGADKEEWLALMQETGALLEGCQRRGTSRKELKQLYNVLSELRAKLRPFGLGISICTSCSAYALISLPTSEQEAHEPERVPPRRQTIVSSKASLLGVIS